MSSRASPSSVTENLVTNSQITEHASSGKHY